MTDTLLNDADAALEIMFGYYTPETTPKAVAPVAADLAQADATQPTEYVEYYQAA